jgi:hypothetical protein
MELVSRREESGLTRMRRRAWLREGEDNGNGAAGFARVS